MVRSVKYIKAFFKLIRTPNLLIIAATMYILRYLVIVPLLKNDGFEPQISEKLFFLLVLATVSIAAAGYVINDYFDRKADLINRPGRVILGRILDRRAGMFWHGVLTGAGIIIGSYVSYSIGHLRFSIVFVVVSGILWFYSTTYKRQVLLGNVIVAILVASVPLIVLLFELPLLLKKYYNSFLSGPTDTDLLVAWVIGYAVFAFQLTLVREIVKDIEDFEGDFAFGRQTIPIVWGTDVAKRIVIGVVLITLVLLGLVVYKLRWSLLTIIYGVAVVAVPLLLFSYWLIEAREKKHYSRLSLLLKIIMLSGIIYTVIAAIWIF